MQPFKTLPPDGYHPNPNTTSPGHKPSASSGSFPGEASSTRNQTNLVQLWKDAESRFLGPEELERYIQATGNHDRARASREARQHEARIARVVAADIFANFPMEENHELAASKCVRDIRYVSAYATMAMLMNDVDWLDEKLLFWLRTMLRAFHFPQPHRPRQVLFADSGASRPHTTAHPAIHFTYTKLRDSFAAVLTPPSFSLMEPPLQRVIDTLTEEP